LQIYTLNVTQVTGKASRSTIAFLKAVLLCWHYGCAANRNSRALPVAGALDLYVTLEERFKYTTTLLLTYRFIDDAGTALEPNARICIYHDVRAVELVSHCRRKRTRKVHKWLRGRMPELDHRWEMNRFLAKWLKFCSNQGHLFLNCTTRPAEKITRLDSR
jgi:uncharacterized protein YqiB (DUF1249 family)